LRDFESQFCKYFTTALINMAKKPRGYAVFSE